MNKRMTVIEMLDATKMIMQGKSGLYEKDTKKKRKSEPAPLNCHDIVEMADAIMSGKQVVETQDNE